MQKNKFALALIFVSVLFTAKAQTIENSINVYGANFPQEKIHIHFDKESYMPGETIWFKAYLFEENLPSERSTNFYVSLYDEQGKLLQQKISPVFKSTSDGYFNIPDSLQPSQLICRAYTSWMLNFDTTMLFTRAIKIIRSESDTVITSDKTVSLQFFPEGGDIVEGVVNTIAFKANYNNGLPFFIDGVIKKQETGEAIMPVIAVHDGMGKFDLDFKPGDKYYAEWADNKGEKQQTMLPAVKLRGVSLKLSVQKDKMYFNLINKTGADSLHVLMYMYQKVFYKAHLAVKANEPFTGVVPFKGLPSGTMQLTVFDAGWNPVAERIAFINNNNYSVLAAVNTTEISTQKRGKNVLEIVVSDTVPTNLSLSISDAGLNNKYASNTIVSDFLLNSGLKGYVHNPAFYFTDNTDAALKNKLDIVMLTHGWRRYNWDDMKAQKMPVIRFVPDDYLGVYGQVAQSVMEKNGKDEMVNLIVKTVDSSNYFYSLRPQSSGILQQTGLVFYDTAKVYFSFNKDKANNSQIAFSKFNFTYPLLHPISNYKEYHLKDVSGTGLINHTSLFQYYQTNDSIKKFNEEKTLKSIVVKTASRRNRSWQNDPLVKIDGKYASGMFSGGAFGYAVDVLHDEKAWNKLDIYTYLRTTMPSLLIGNFSVSGGRAISYSGKSVLIYIDEHEMTTSELETLSLSQVAYIKLIPYFIGSGAEAGSAGLQPALAVYTRKGDDMIDRRPTGKDLGVVKIAGYAPIKEFYSPDYSQSNTESGTIDARSTLLWVPYILTDKANLRIPVTFYNNDFTKKMRIVLEGINDEGKMIRIEKIVE